MKKTLLMVAALMLAFASSHAQTEKGTQTLGLGLQYLQTNGNGGTVSINNSITTVKSSSVSIGPQYSYFVSDKLDLGASLSYANSTNTDIYPSAGISTLSKQTSQSYGGSVYLRKYLMYNDKFGLRVGPVFEYTHTKNSSVYVSGTDISNDGGYGNDYALGATAELVYYPAKHLGLSAMLANVGYSYGRNHDSYGGDSETSKSFYANLVNNGLGLSVFYSFGGK